jgi:hypothetical protein
VKERHIPITCGVGEQSGRVEAVGGEGTCRERKAHPQRMRRGDKEKRGERVRKKGIRARGQTEGGNRSPFHVVIRSTIVNLPPLQPQKPQKPPLSGVRAHCSRIPNGRPNSKKTESLCVGACALTHPAERQRHRPAFFPALARSRSCGCESDTDRTDERRWFFLLPAPREMGSCGAVSVGRSGGRVSQRNTRAVRAVWPACVLQPGSQCAMNSKQLSALSAGVSRAAQSER